MIKRLTSVALVCILLSCFLMIPAHAETLTGSATPGYVWADSLDNLYAGTQVLFSTNWSYTGTSNGFLPVKVGSSNRSAYSGLTQLQGFSSPESITGNLVIACSYFYQDYGTFSFTLLNDFPINVYYNDTIKNDNLKVVSDGISTFTPTTNYSNYSTGVTLTVTLEGSEDNPLSNPRLTWDARTLYAYGPKSSSYSVVCPSFRVIASSAPSAELSQLQDIAKGIAESNRILSAMYGDILAVCNSIYERTGDLLTAQNLTNQYFSSIIPVIEGLKTTTDNIYTLLSQQFSLLISTIQTESDDIQATINAAIDKMIAYLDNAFSGAVNPALPGQSQDITTNNGTVHDAESNYQSTATERFDAISADFAGFDGSILSGVALGGSLFQRVWNVLGDYVIIYTFPLTLSICLVVVGRVSRNASRSRGSGVKKKDGDDS